MTSGTRREVNLRFLAEPSDVNFGGKVHGGMVMKWIDQAGYACAAGWSGCYCVTVYVGGIRFIRPIRIGDLVEVRARVIFTGNSSMHIAVDVSADDPRRSAAEKTTHCVIVFVAMGEDSRPTPVPHWDPITEGDRELEQYARKLMSLRTSIDAEVARFLEPAHDAR
ncbi:acyl-CoA thioesterase [Antrihabitans sp. YC2-6]|uniref:acyl-CoA thioesterase n=1 Tax=Antrihabitans sp. YC2-6 TaxID=2799498 RepID=UPI0018F49DF0|nr:acyl-CoA thioesterase [Antrihabitans sp. YC2-6]MBJ8346641.1 acyl-CoA thioesterase [Antrihabitans sp. YC2-6]